MIVINIKIIFFGLSYLPTFLYQCLSRKAASLHLSYYVKSVFRKKKEIANQTTQKDALHLNDISDFLISRPTWKYMQVSL